MDKPSKIELSSLIIVMGFFAAVAFHYITGFYLDKPYQLNTFLFPSKIPFSDFYSVYNSDHFFSPYTLGTRIVGSVYFPWTYIVMYPFCFFNSKIVGVTTFISFCTIGIISLVTYYVKRKTQTTADTLLNIKNIFILSVLTYPFLFSFERGNVELLVFISLAFFLFFYERKNYKISAIFLASAISMKLFPIVFIVLFFSDKHYRAGFLCTIIVAFMTLISLLLLKGDTFLEIDILLNNLGWFRDYYARSILNMPFNSSFYAFSNMIGQIFHLTPSIFYNLVSLTFVKQYTLWGAAFFIGIASYLLLVPMDFWKKVTFLTFCMILLPHISYDYKLIHIYLPFFFFINAKNNLSKKNNIIYTLLFALLLIPKNYYLIYGPISISGMLNTIILSFMLFYIALETFYTNRVFKKTPLLIGSETV